MRNPTPPLLALVTAALLPGCIVQDIHDQIADANVQLGEINGGFSEVQKANVMLAALDERLTKIEAELGTTNEHLASLRKTINNIDSTIPFLSLSGDDDEAKETLEGDGTEAPVSDKPAEEPAE